MDEQKKTYLDRIELPSDLKKLSPEELVLLSEELRQFIIELVSANPGHLGASLGVVELSVALHYVFDTPYDQLIWDVGHQAYGHKILTGRKNVFYTNRKYKGISGFPKMSESVYDSFGVGHSSTSISAALGMAVASKLKNEPDRHVIAVIGDGSMTGGLAFEGLNNAGFSNANLLVILNDNNMAIDPNVGALQQYLLNMSTSKSYNKFKSDVWKVLGTFGKLKPNPQRVAQKLEGAVKSALLKHSNLFESLNFRYFGPVDGHDVMLLAKVLNDLKDIPGPKLLHVVTTKGKGYKFAEEDQTKFHAPGLFNKDTGEIIKSVSATPQPPKFQEVFGRTLLELAEVNPKIVGVTPAMVSGCSMNYLFERFPDRAFDVGIAEQHAITFSAGLAAQGMVPYCNVYSSFLQRAYDQIIHDVAIQNLHVVLCIDRGGLVGEDGATHHGVYDLAYLRCIPNLTVASPMVEEDLRDLMFTAQDENHGPFVIRYPKGPGVTPDWHKPFKKMTIGKGRMLRDGSDLVIITLGAVGNFAEEACSILAGQGISAAHVDMRFLKPLDTELLHTVLDKFNAVITIEDGVINGGFGSAVLEFMAEHGYSSKVKRLGVPDRFVEHGTQAQLYHECGFDTTGIVEAARALVGAKVVTNVL
ncbi:MAG: 1-deoxy-D-xylulose-5-phosphate synthase [Bacteroidota bacterium]|nr:1-deoxy-D-xylulose-5-phosphate synthase [Bacteroidota bacterium]